MKECQSIRKVAENLHLKALGCSYFEVLEEIIVIVGQILDDVQQYFLLPYFVSRKKLCLHLHINICGSMLLSWVSWAKQDYSSMKWWSYIFPFHTAVLGLSSSTLKCLLNGS